MHSRTDALGTRHTSRWPRDLQSGMQHKAARAATTPFLGYSQPGTPPPPCARPRRRRRSTRPLGRVSLLIRSLAAYQSELAPGSEQGREPQPAPRGGGVRSPQRAAGPLAAAAAAAASGQAVPAHRVVENGGAGAAGGRACRQHGGAANQAGLRAQDACALWAWILPDPASQCQEAPQNAPLSTQLLLHQGHSFLRGL